MRPRRRRLKPAAAPARRRPAADPYPVMLYRARDGRSFVVAALDEAKLEAALAELERGLARVLTLRALPEPLPQRELRGRKICLRGRRAEKYEGLVREDINLTAVLTFAAGKCGLKVELGDHFSLDGETVFPYEEAAELYDRLHPPPRAKDQADPFA